MWMSMTGCTELVIPIGSTRTHSPHLLERAAREDAQHLPAIHRTRCGSGERFAGLDRSVSQTLDEFRGVFLADKPVGSLFHEHRRRIHSAEGDARVAADALLVHIPGHGNPGERIADRITGAQLVIRAA